MGNLPCSDAVGISNEGKIITQLMNDFRPAVRKGRSNKQKQLANEMTKFLRWCLFKAEESRPSIFALVLPSTFAQNESFVYARKYLTELVSELWVLNFDADNRAGHHSENLFNTLQGRLLLVGTIRELNMSLPTIHYKDINRLSLREKKAFFSAEVDLNNWKTVKLDKKYALKPSAAVDEELYASFWHLRSEENPAIFQRDCSGLKLAPTHLLIHFSKGQLKRRSRFIADENNTYDQIKERWYKGQTKPPAQRKLTSAVKQALANSEMNIIDYAYRPFLTASLILDHALMDALRNTPGGGMRERPEVQAAYKDDGVFGFAVAPAPADISPTIKKFSSFCWNIPDNDLATRGNAHVFCNRFPEYKSSKKEWSSNPTSNINPKLLEALSDTNGSTVEYLNNAMVYYSYACLNSELYMHTFEGKLHTVAGEWASIPITANKKLFDSMVSIGMKMANVEKDDYNIPEDELLALLGEQFSRTYEECEVYSGKCEDGCIKMMDVQGRIILTIDIPENILTFEVSGYNIIEQWLKYHSYAYYRKSCNGDDFHNLFNLIGRISAYLKLVKECDSIMKNILKSELIKPIKGHLK